MPTHLGAAFKGSLSPRLCVARTQRLELPVEKSRAWAVTVVVVRSGTIWLVKSRDGGRSNV